MDFEEFRGHAHDVAPCGRELERRSHACALNSCVPRMALRANHPMPFNGRTANTIDGAE